MNIVTKWTVEIDGLRHHVFYDNVKAALLFRDDYRKDNPEKKVVLVSVAMIQQEKNESCVDR